ncbi:hypothetical protein SAMN05421754_1001294 [Nitrosomonas sp. Nm58]|nr:hypothetical protein SAMN05421754_1001294 [Nitrosomonas sp. Nm58]
MFHLLMQVKRMNDGTYAEIRKTQLSIVSIAAKFIITPAFSDSGLIWLSS